jgi:hypothetical protein
METINEGGKNYELREIKQFTKFEMSKKVTVIVCNSPFTGKEVSFYATGSTCITKDAQGNQFAAKYARNGKYYARAFKPM